MNGVPVPDDSIERESAFEQRLHAAIAEALRHAMVPGMVMEDSDDPFPFVDLMSVGGTTIATGEERIKDFAEAVTMQVLELLDGVRP